MSSRRETKSFTWTAVGTRSELAGPGPHAVSAGPIDLVLVRRGDTLIALEGLCPHQGALLGEGTLDGDELVCSNHGWRFDAETGARQGGPQCLARFPVSLDDNDVLVDVSGAGRRGAPDRALRTWKDLPGPRGLPVLGSLFDLDVPRLHRVLEAWAAEYGSVFRFKSGSTRWIVFSDPDLTRSTLRARPESFRRATKIETLFRELGTHGVFSAEGDEWRPMRRLAMHALSHRHLKGFYPVLLQVTKRLLHRLDRAAEAAETLDIHDVFMRFTVDVTTTLAFGRDVNTLDGGDDVIQRKMEPLFPALARRLNAPLPYWRYVKLRQDRVLDRALQDLRGWMSGIIEETRADLAADPGRAERPTNFLEAMLSAGDAHGEPFGADVVMGNALTMLFAGEDTTANALSWAVHHLIDSPDANRRLRLEADEMLGDEEVPGEISTAGALDFALAVANETLRLRPVAPFLFLAANAPTHVGDVAVEPGQLLCLLMRPPLLDEANFPNAPDFLPSRWLERDSNATNAQNAVYIPFGTGPRICPGRTLALLEMRMVLASIAKRYDITRVGQPEDVWERFSFTMSPVGLAVRLERRP